jgi:hypothetical protein
MLGIFDPNDPTAAAQALLTQEQLAAQQKVAQSLLERAKRSRPMTHWSQALAQAVEGAMGGLAQREAGDAAARAAAYDRTFLSGDLSAPGSTPAIVPTPSSMPSSDPANPIVPVQAGPGGEGDTGAPASLIANESGGRWNAQNSVVGAGGKVGHFGRLQFGQARIEEAAAAGAIPVGTTPAQFMANPDLQRAAERWHWSDIDNHIRANGFDKMLGQTIAGAPVTMDGMRAVAHLGGKGGLSRFIKTGGRYDPDDANGTHLSDYFRRHGTSRQQQRAEAPAPVVMAQGPSATMSDADPIQIDRAPATVSIVDGGRVEAIPGDDPRQLRAQAAAVQATDPNLARQYLARAQMAEGAAGAPMPAIAPDAAVGMGGRPMVAPAAVAGQPASPFRMPEGAGSSFAPAGTAPAAQVASTGPILPPPVARADVPLPAPRPAAASTPVERVAQAMGAPGVGPGLSAEDGGALAFAPQMQPGSSAPSAAPAAMAAAPAAAAPMNPIQAVAAALTGRQPAAATPQGSPGQAAVAQALGVNPRVLAAATSPYASPATKQVAGLILRQQMEASQKNAEYNRPDAVQQRQLTIEGQQLTNDKTRRDLSRVEVETMTAPDGTVFEREKGKPGAQWQQSLKLPQKPKEPNVEIIRDAATGEIIAVDKNDVGAGVKKLREGGPSKEPPPTRMIKQPDGSEVAVEWDREKQTWVPMRAPEGGAAIKAPAKLTEQQSKDLVYYNRGLQALETLGDGSSLTGNEGLVGATIGQVPILGNYAKSEGYQKAEQAGRNYLNSILRKDTGAAITKPEMEIYGGVFLPQPGDGPAVLAQKAEARKQALDAVRDGLGPAEVLALGQRLTRREDARVPAPDKPGQVPGSTSTPTAKRPADKDPLGLFQ